MDIKQLRAFLAIADTGSITRASETLHLVQPALSRQLRMLEDELGTPLFERTPRGMELTDAGARLVERARRALREIDGARTEIRAANPGAVRGTVDVGLLTSQSELISAPLVAALKTSHPELLLRIYTGYSDRLREWLETTLRDPAREFPLFPAGLAFLMLLPPKRALALLRERTETLAATIERDRAALTAVRDRGLPRLFLLDDEYRLAMAEAEHAWIAGLVGELEAGTVTWSKKMIQEIARRMAASNE